MVLLSRAAGALAALLMLPGCLVTPGSFTSTLDIRADRSFAFAYKGEILASDMDKALGGLNSDAEEDPLEGVAPPEGEEAANEIVVEGQVGPPKSDPVEEFDFEEDTEGADHNKYAWANSAYAMAVNINMAFKLYGWCTRIRGIESGGAVEVASTCRRWPHRSWRARAPTLARSRQPLERRSVPRWATCSRRSS